MIKGNIISNSLTREKLENFLSEKYPGQFDCSKVPDHFYQNDLLTLICLKDGHGEFQTTYTKIRKNSGNPCWICRAHTKEELYTLRAERGLPDTLTFEDVPDFFFPKDEIIVNCKIHGKFKTTYEKLVHYIEPCPKCRRCQHPVLTKYYLIQFVEDRFPGQYSFDKVPETFKYTDKIILTCKKHGDFEITFHRIKLNKNLCKECIKGIYKPSCLSPTREKVEELCHLYFNDMYDCSLVPETFYHRTKFQLIEKETGKIILINYRTLKSKSEKIKKGFVLKNIKQARVNKLTKEKLISFSEKKYGKDAFDFSMVPKSFKKQDKFDLICNKDGYKFETSWERFTRAKVACPECRNNVDFSKLTKDDILKLNEELFKDFNYDYSKVPERFSYQEPLTIICPIHGDFQITYQVLKNAKIPCDKCRMLQKADLIKYIEDNFIDTDYDYSLVPDTFRTSTKFTIICPKHGPFETTYNQIIHHFSDKRKCVCDKCNDLRIKEYFLNDFKRRANIIHNNFYDYSKSEYNGSLEITTIICPIHGEFQQQINSHLQGVGCPLCGEKHTKTRDSVLRLLEDNNIEYITEKTFSWLVYKQRLQLDFYLPEYKLAIEVQGIQHFISHEFFDHNGDTLEYRIARDRTKYNLCKQHGIDILYFAKENFVDNYEFGELITDFDTLLELIKQHKL